MISADIVARIAIVTRRELPEFVKTELAKTVAANAVRVKTLESEHELRRKYEMGAAPHVNAANDRPHFFQRKVLPPR
jgi:hypothetical protein